MLLKFAKIDSSDRKALDMFRKEVKSKEKILILDFEANKAKGGGHFKQTIKAPYICLGSRVYVKGSR